MRTNNLPDLRQHRSVSTPPMVMDNARFAQTRGNAQLTADPTYRKVDGKWTEKGLLSLAWLEDEDDLPREPCHCMICENVRLSLSLPKDDDGFEEDQTHVECQVCHEVYNRFMPKNFRNCQCTRVDMSDSDHIPTQHVP